MKPNIEKALTELEQTLNNSGLKSYATARVYMEKYRNGETPGWSAASVILSIKSNADKCSSLPGLPLGEALAYQEISQHCFNIALEFMEGAINAN